MLLQNLCPNEQLCVRNNVHFLCPHTKEVSAAEVIEPELPLLTEISETETSPYHQTIICRNKLHSSLCDADMKDQVMEIISLANDVVGFKINEFCFIVKSQLNAVCTTGWQHVYIDRGISCFLR